MTTISMQRIKERFYEEVFSNPLIENSLRGYWCEMMVAEALGRKCRIVGREWHPWDLQIGPDQGKFPERIRIQVKNSARLQTWNVRSGKISDCMYNITYRKRPDYFERDNVGVECEPSGFLCDIYVLCHHSESDPDRADHRDPSQWEFFLLPITGKNCGLTSDELAWVRKGFENSGKPSSCQRRPLTMTKGIRGRPAIAPIGIDDLSLGSIMSALGIETRFPYER